MTSKAARDLRYGRRGGGWAEGAPRPLPDGHAAPRAPLAAHERFHPETRAKARAHTRERLSCPANDKDGGHVADCTCQPSTEMIEQEWRGQARMAHARKTAGLSLSAADRQAIDRYPDPPR